MPSEKKIRFVQEFAKQIGEYPVIALVDMQSLPARQLQNMRAQLNKKGILVVMARKRLLEHSLADSKKENITLLIEKMRGMPALLLSRENPFVLYATLQKSKSQAPAKANQIAPKDIIVRSGGTNFAPGPIISELAGVGIKTKVEGGKLTIINDTTVAKEGDLITFKLAEVLKRLDIQPMEIGLNLVAAWDNAIIFSAKQLHIDEAEYCNNIITAFQEAFNLAVEVAYPTADTIEVLLQKAFGDSKALALEQEILTDLTTEDILAKSERQALSLKNTAGLEIPDKKEQPRAEKKKEEPLPEAKAGPEQKVEKQKPEPKPAEQAKPEPQPEPKEDIPSAEEMIRATQEKFAPGAKKAEPKPENKPSAESLVEEEIRKADAEKPPKEVLEVEQLYEKLKKEGSLK